jgi:hypothetical protein
MHLSSPLYFQACIFNKLSIFWYSSGSSAVQQHACMNMRQSITENHKSYFHITTSLQNFAFFGFFVHSMFTGQQSSNPKPESINTQHTFVLYSTNFEKHLRKNRQKSAEHNSSVFTVYRLLYCHGKFRFSGQLGFRWYRGFRIWDKDETQHCMNVCQPRV